MDEFIKMLAVAVVLGSEEINEKMAKKYDEMKAKAETFKRGDVIISEDDGDMMILDSVKEISGKFVPHGLVQYVPGNKDKKLFISKEPTFGIGPIDNFRPATDEEKEKLLDILRSEGYYDFDFKEFKLRYVPTPGDLCIFWNEGHEDKAVIAELSEIRSRVKSPFEFVTNSGVSYECCTRFLDNGQFTDLIHSKDNKEKEPAADKKGE